MNKTLELMNDRTSIRSYESKEVSESDLQQILHAAMRAPTAGNMMLYSIIVIKDASTRATLSKTCDDQPFIAAAPVSLIFLADLQRTYDYFEYSNVREACKRKGLDFDKPSTANLMLAISDAMIAAQNAVIAAESLGLGTCYIGDIMENYEIHKELLDLPDYVFPIGMLTLGHPKEPQPQPRQRFPQETIVYNEKYQRMGPDAFEQMYHPYSSKMNFSEHPDAENYGQHLYFRKFGSDFAKEMARSVECMLKYWI